MNPSLSTSIPLIARERWVADYLENADAAGPHVIELPYLRVLSGEWHMLTESNELIPNHFVSTLDGKSSIYLGGNLEGGRRILKVPAGDNYYAGRYYLMGGSSNYAHWVYDVLPRLFAREEIPALQHLPIITDGPLATYQKEYLQLLGITPNNLLHLPYPGGFILQSAIIPSWRSDRSFGVPVDRARQLHWIRQKLNDAVPHAIEEIPKIYLSRRRERPERRRLANEDNLIPIAEAAGYAIVDAELLTASEQIALFRQAKAIVAVHGAAVANTLFSSEDARIVEIMNDDFDQAYAPHRWYSGTAQMLGQPYRRLTGQPVHREGHPIDRPAQIDPNHFRTALAWAACETEDYPQIHAACF